jgi:peptidoglycan hydrolase CwlO-like protein
MKWLIVLIVLTYLFSTAISNKYREESIELREKNLKDKADFNKEIASLLEENAELNCQIDELKEEMTWKKTQF